MAMTPRRPMNPKDAAEALFRPAKKPAAPVVERRAAPDVKELVSIKLDSAVIEHFQKDGPGWQDRINDALRAVVERDGGE
ncbi:BrnA antitoxin family protein [Rhizobium sp. 'Codium 1']|uniref:BrnA antitoxin family protein n=1 Tax=Rhizobium sp. 'Codium 1' TaxID=2940484 RepID=UPI001E421521|nr:BrnA antitoxin family protein [Rhizobium sp. 'Codium 1']MCC8931205.1 BrnA antitoxin family protein [Rhizobium sp. 'Codium 1']